MLENLDFFYSEIDYRLTILKIQYGLPIKKSFFTFKRSVISGLFIFITYKKHARLNYNFDFSGGSYGF